MSNLTGSVERSLLSPFGHRRGKGGAVLGFEEGGAGYERVGAGGGAEGAGFEVHAAIDFEAEIQVLLCPPRGQLLDFGHHVFAETLTAEAGLHRHHQHQINLGEEAFYRISWSVGIEHNTVLTTELADSREGGAVIIVGLDVNADEIRPGLRERFDVAVGLGQHQVGVEESVAELGKTTQRGYDSRTKREIRHEVPIHDIEVQPLQAVRGHDGGTIAKCGVVSGQERRGENGGELHGAQSSDPLTKRPARCESRGRLVALPVGAALGIQRDFVRHRRRSGASRESRDRRIGCGHCGDLPRCTVR